MDGKELVGIGFLEGMTRERVWIIELIGVVVLKH